MYFNLFKSIEDVKSEFRLTNELDNAIVLVAAYIQEGYEGSAFVLYAKEGKLYEVHASHCSCNGLEDGWSPEETTWPAIAHRLVNGYFFYNQPEVFTEYMKTLTCAFLLDKPEEE